MRIRLSPLAAVAVFVALATAPGAAAADYVPGEVIVKYAPGADHSERAGVQDETGTGRVEQLPGDSRKLNILDGESVHETVSELRSDPNVEYAVPNYVAHASAFFPNDPGPGSGGNPGDWTRFQWNFFGPASVNAPDAWQLAAAAGAAGGRGAKVAVLDTGVAFQTRRRYKKAPDLSSKTFVRGYDFVANDRYPNDLNGHGTHVAGTIAEKTNNGSGLTGLAYGAKIMPLRVLNSDGEGDAAAISRAIRYAGRKRVDVINLSLEFDSSVTASQIPDIVSAVHYAHRKGAVIVAAAGNQADTAVAYPARALHVISVAATTEHQCEAEYSNSGRGLDVSAPGGGYDAPNQDNPADIRNCDPNTGGRDIFQQTFVRGYRKFGFPPDYEGTSMASPHVSATAAMLIATGRLGPDPTPDAVEHRLEETARDLGPAGYDDRYGFGLIDAAAALRP
jgi:serine protease